MKTSKAITLMTMVRWSPALNATTSSKFDEEFSGCVATVLEAAEAGKSVVAWAYAARVAALASIISGQAELQIPLAKMLWEEWAEALLKLEIQLVENNSDAARQAYQRLTGACIAAQRWLDRPGWQQ